MIVKYIVHSNVFVSFCVAILTMASFAVLNKDVGYNHVCVSFFATLCMYNLHRYSGASQQTATDPRALSGFLSPKVALWIGIISLGAVVLFAVNLSLNEFGVLLPAGLISIFYVADLFLKKRHSGLRAIPFVKIFLIAFSWSIVTVAFPLTEELLDRDARVVVLFIERFFFILAITIPFDIRDLGIDNKGLRTIPQVMGVTRAKTMSVVFLAVAAAITIFLMNQRVYSFDFAIPAVLCYGLIGALLVFTHRKRPDYYFTILIEGTMCLWGLIVLFCG